MDRKLYTEKCSNRWDREALIDAKSNWLLFSKHHQELIEILKPYLKNNWCPDLAGQSQNPEGTLTAWLWKCGAAEDNHFIWDFCSHYQKAHLRRGLLFYCEQLIEELKAREPNDQPELIAA